MRIMKITPELYVKYFHPTADYLIVQRLVLDYKKIGNIDVPEIIQRGSVRFISIGKVLAISGYSSDDEHVEYMKDAMREQMPDLYVGYSLHVPAELAILPQFTFDDNVSLIMLHVKDITIIPENMGALMAMHAAYEVEEDEKDRRAKASLEAERMRLKEGPGAQAVAGSN